jgi:phosphinothricin acetyltransferase
MASTYSAPVARRPRHAPAEARSAARREEDEDATVLGYAYSGRFRPRAAYARTRETSVYLAPEALGRGLGRLVYSQLLSLLREDRMHCAVAVVAVPNPASVALHESLGFTLVGTLHQGGGKFGRWVDTRWYELLLEP